MFRDVPGCSGMFRNVPECSGMFHVPGFIDGLLKVPKRGRHLLPCHAMLGANMKLGVSFLTIGITKVNSVCDLQRMG